MLDPVTRSWRKWVLAVLPPNGTGRTLYLDGWRGMAILLVLIGHFSPAGSVAARTATAGVECFFVLSGRLMAELLIFRRQPLPSFFVRRASRLLPALFAYVLITLAVLSTIGLFAGQTDAWISALAALAFVQNYLPHEFITGIYEHSWSLAVEEHSYLILALLVFGVARARSAAMAFAIVLALAAMLNGYHLQQTSAEGVIYWRTDVRAASILLSFGTYIWAVGYFGQQRHSAWAWAAPVCLVAGLVLVADQQWPEHLRYSLGTALLALAVNTVDVAHPLMKRLLASRLFIWFGIMSYSLYLWQQPFFLAHRAGAPFLLCLGLAAGAAVWSFHRVERPARDYLNGRWKRRHSGSVGELSLRGGVPADEPQAPGPVTAIR